VANLSRTLGQPYRLIGRLAGGESGAYEVAGPAGERLVAKWEADAATQVLRREAAQLSERLRQDAGWPVPRERVHFGNGLLFVLQDFMPGEPVDRLTDRLLERLLRLHRRRLGLATPQDTSHWPEPLITTLITGGNGYCHHESLWHHSARTAKVVANIEDFGRRLNPADLPGRDVVHWDFHLGNMLQENGNLSAIVDTDFAVVGDARFDLVALALSSLTTACDERAHDSLFSAAFDELSPLQTRAYLSHLLLRHLDWAIRRHRVKGVEFWLQQAESLLPL
jgi:Ser/Thr protein kinase RdoA (MazF antagonist)